MDMNTRRLFSPLSPLPSSTEFNKEPQESTKSEAEENPQKITEVTKILNNLDRVEIE